MSQQLDRQTTATISEGIPWRRFHPLTPAVKVGLLGIAFLGYLGHTVLDNVLDGEGGRAQAAAADLASDWVVALLVIVAGVTIFTAALALSWWVTTYRLTGDLVEMRRGVLFRSHEQTRFDRIAAVDIRRPLLARLLRLSSVVVRTSGIEGELRMDFLTQADALTMRDTLRRVSVQFSDDTEADASAFIAPAADPESSPTSDPDELEVGSADTLASISIPAARILGAAVLGPVGAMVIGGLLSLAVSVLTGFEAARYGFIGLIFASLGFVHTQILSRINFRLDASAAALTVHQGLLEVQSSTVPYRRITAVEVEQKLLWRPFGWWSININQTSMAMVDLDLEGRNSVLPVGNLKDVRAVLALLEADLPESLLLEGLTGSGAEGSFRGATPKARVYDWLNWRRNGYHLSDSAVLLRAGRFVRNLQIMPYSRLQSYTCRQGPLNRLAGLAKVRLDAPNGFVMGEINHLEQAEANRLISAVDSLARQARADRQAAS